MRRQGYNLDKLARQVAAVFGAAPAESFHTTKRPALVAARSVFCYWAVRELGVATVAIPRRPGLTQSAVSRAVRRGERLATEQGVALSQG